MKGTQRLFAAGVRAGVVAAVTLMVAAFVRGDLLAETESAQSVSLAVGESLTVRCPTTLQGAVSGSSSVIMCAPRPTRTPTATTLPTQRPSATALTPPTATAPAVPTSTGNPLPAVDPVMLGTCPAAVHDRYTVTGPDGKLYRTWHPPTVPINPSNPAQGNCTFAHEHGDDPRTSLANSSLPPFGYASQLIGENEPHEGFKIFVANRAVVNDEGRDAKTSTRMVAHMGTGGPGRFTNRFHSLIFDLIAPTGYAVHVQGMADTQNAGSICQRDDPANHIGRTVMIPPGSGCDTTSLYEIWQFTLKIGDRATIIASTAAFDPITVMNPADRSFLLYTADAFAGSSDASLRGPQYGCNREAYFGPVYWYNAGRPTVYQTDAYGQIQAGGPLRQEVSAHSALGIPMSPDQTQFKLHTNQCVPGLGLKN